MKTFFEIMNKNLMDVNELDIIDYVKELERRKFKNATLNRKIYSLSKICSIYKKLGLVKRNVVKEVSKTTRINKREKRRISLNIVKEDVITVVNRANPRTALHIFVQVWGWNQHHAEHLCFEGFRNEYFL